MSRTDRRLASAVPFAIRSQDKSLEPVDRDALVAELRLRGIGFLQPSDAAPGPVAMDDDTLIARLAAHSDARLRHSLAMLFLRRPELGARVPELVRTLDPAAAQELRAHYTAAVYLQRFWRTRLGQFIPAVPELPDWFSEAMDLPSPATRFGKVGLHALADRSPYALLESYDAMIELLFDQLERECRHELAPTR